MKLSAPRDAMRWWRWPTSRCSRRATLVTLGEISRRQDISLPYLEQLFVKLRRAELVDSVRGPGRRLSAGAAAAGDPGGRDPGGGGRDGERDAQGRGRLGRRRRARRAQSLTNRLWEGLSAHVYVFLHQTRLSDVVGNELAPCPAVPALFAVVDEA